MLFVAFFRLPELVVVAVLLVLETVTLLAAALVLPSLVAWPGVHVLLFVAFLRLPELVVVFVLRTVTALVLPVVLTSMFAGVSTQNCHICTPSHEIQVGHSPFSLVASDTAFEDLRTKADDLRPAHRLSGAEEGPKTAFLCWIYVKPKKKETEYFSMYIGLPIGITAGCTCVNFNGTVSGIGVVKALAGVSSIGGMERGGELGGNSWVETSERVVGRFC